MPSASYPASSRVASLTRTCCVVARGEGSGEEGEGKGTQASDVYWRAYTGPIPVSVVSRRGCF